jgi:hypothetical protein
MLSLLLTVLILGVIAWGITQIPMPQPFRTIAFVILIIILIIVLFSVLGVTPSLPLR